MNRKYEYATDKIYNLSGNEGNKYRAHCYKWQSLEMSDDPIKRKGFILVFVYIFIFINSSADTSFSTEPVSVVAGNSTHRETIKGAWQKPCTLISFF